MSRPLVLVLILAVAAAVVLATSFRHSASQSKAVAVHNAILTAPTPTPSPAATPAAGPANGQPHSAARPVAQATAEPSATAAPILVTAAPATVGPTPTPLATSAARPVPVQTHVPVLAAPPTNASVPRVDSEAPPKILSVAISNQVVAVGQVVNGQVETTSNVASVEASVAGYVAPLEKTGVGRFVLAYRVPNLPFFLRHRTYSITVIAHNVRGDSTQTTVPITIH